MELDETEFDDNAKTLLALMSYIKSRDISKGNISQGFQFSITQLRDTIQDRNSNFKKYIQNVLADNIRPHNETIQIKNNI